MVIRLSQSVSHQIPYMKLLLATEMLDQLIYYKIAVLYRQYFSLSRQNFDTLSLSIHKNYALY